MYAICERLYMEEMYEQCVPGWMYAPRYVGVYKYAVYVEIL